MHGLAMYSNYYLALLPDESICIAGRTKWRKSALAQQKQRKEFRTKIGMISLFTLGTPKMV